MFQKDYPKKKDYTWNSEWIYMLGRSEYYTYTHDFEHFINLLHCNVIDKLFRNERRYRNIKDLYKELANVNDYFKEDFERFPKISNEIKLAFVKEHPFLQKKMVTIRNKDVLLNENNPDIILLDLSKYTRLGYNPTIFLKGRVVDIPYLIYYKKSFYLCLEKKVYK